MEELIDNSVIKALVLSSFGRLGPQPIYTFPREVEEDELREMKKDPECHLRLCMRDYIQISIKNLSLLLGDRLYTNYEEIKDFQHFGILPYPDFNLTSLTYFRFITTKFSEKPIPCSFSIMVEENKRSYLFNNITRLKPLVKEFFNKIEEEIQDSYKPHDEVEPIFKDLLLKLIDLEVRPYAPVTIQRKMKILFAGLDDSGKTSFLLSIDRKYSKLIGLKPTRGVSVNSIEALGATIFLWDLGGQLTFREKYLKKSQIYLYEADLLFYFIDLKNKERFDESFEYLKSIKDRLQGFEQNTPIIFILSKADSDIIGSEETKEHIQALKTRIVKETSIENPDIYITSIFSIFTILRAFSSGISKLSPNKELINHNLNIFSTQIGAYLTLMLSTDGLVLADYYSPKAILLTELNQSELIKLEDKDANIKNVFEVTAPQFAMLYKIFSKFRTLEEDEAVFRIANSLILFKKIQVGDYPMFILFLIDDDSKRKKITELLPGFLNLTRDLLLRYIS